MGRGRAIKVCNWVRESSRPKIVRRTQQEMWLERGGLWGLKVEERTGECVEMIAVGGGKFTARIKRRGVLKKGDLGMIGWGTCREEGK